MTPPLLAQKLYTPAGLSLDAELPDVNTVLHLGCGHTKRKGATGIDVLPLPEVDIVHNLDTVPWPVPAGHYDLVIAHNVLEHLDDIPQTMQEIARVLRPGGRVVIAVPYFRHIDAMTDPTHKHFFTARSLDYFVQSGEGLAAYDYTEPLFIKRGFWYGWPHEPRNLLRRWLKHIFQASPIRYDQYVSLLVPTQLLIWELEHTR